MTGKTKLVAPKAANPPPPPRAHTASLDFSEGLLMARVMGVASALGIIPWGLIMQPFGIKAQIIGLCVQLVMLAVVVVDCIAGHFRNQKLARRFK